MFKKILNTCTIIFLDLFPNINDTINPMFIKIYNKIGIRRFILEGLNTNNATKNKTKVKMIGKNSLSCFNVLSPCNLKAQQAFQRVLILNKTNSLCPIKFY